MKTEDNKVNKAPPLRCLRFLLFALSAIPVAPPARESFRVERWTFASASCLPLFLIRLLLLFELRNPHFFPQKFP